MASFMQKMKSGVPALGQIGDRPRSFLGGYVVDKGERLGAAAGFGFLKGYYRERAAFRGVPADLLAGAGLVGLSALLEIWSGGRSKLAPHLNAVGDMGLASWIGSKAAGWGARKSGRLVYVLDAGAKAPKGLTEVRGIHEVLGHDDPVGGGAYLSADEVMRYSGQR